LSERSESKRGDLAPGGEHPGDAPLTVGVESDVAPFRLVASSSLNDRRGEDIGGFGLNDRIRPADPG
jgi:hypothetical protein